MSNVELGRDTLPLILYNTSGALNVLSALAAWYNLVYTASLPLQKLVDKMLVANIARILLCAAVGSSSLIANSTNKSLLLFAQSLSSKSEEKLCSISSSAVHSC